MPASLYTLPFQIDHVIARQHEGETSFVNLALACCHCNARKGPNLAGRDQLTGAIVRLFHPRTDRWAEHFAWAGAELRGLTAAGRVTIQVLAINTPDFLAVREALIQEGAWMEE